jgi:polygalacturonase
MAKNMLCPALIVFLTGIALGKTIVNVVDFGAKGDGTTNDQAAIQKAIDSCGAQGATVVLRKGTFLSGQLKLVDNLTLFIDSSATLLGIQSDSEAHYPHHFVETRFPNRMKDDCQRRLLYGNGVKNVTITGGGAVNGQGDFAPWLHVKELGTEKDRPSLIAFVGSKNITVSNLKLLKPACWTQVYIESDSICLSRLYIHSENLTPNRDGIDIVDCHHVRIEECSIFSEDDGICFKSGSEYGCIDAVVKKCRIDKLKVNAGNCFKLGTDGLGCFRNFEVSGLQLKNAVQNSAFAIESMDGAVIDDLAFSDCTIDSCGQAVFVMLADRRRTVPGRPTRIGAVSNIRFRNIRGRNFTRQYPSIVTGIKNHAVQNISFINVDFVLKGGITTADSQSVMEYDGKYPEGSRFGNTGAFGFFMRHIDKVLFENCRIAAAKPDARPWLVTDDVGECTTK